MVKVWKLGLTSFDTAMKIQVALARKHLDAMMKGQNTQQYDTILLVEHKPIYTVDMFYYHKRVSRLSASVAATKCLYASQRPLLRVRRAIVCHSFHMLLKIISVLAGYLINGIGHRSGIRDDTAPSEILRLKNLGADFRRTNRGGLITFHGPGQLVAYPVLNLKHFKTSVRWYVTSLEDTIIKMCADLGIKAERSEHTGVWVDDNKLAAIGIHASRYVTTHGISLNCNNDLSWFQHIDPCGIDDKGVTSLSEELCDDYSTDRMTPLFLKSFSKVFGCQTEDLEVKYQEEILNGIYNKLLSDSVAVPGPHEIKVA